MRSGPVRTLPVSFYERDVVRVARELIGCELRRDPGNGQVLAGRIVETEAYRHDDPASHSFGGPSAHNAAMFGPAGHAYVYLIYGIYDCFNVVCGAPGVADAVLVRAVEPTMGLATMARNRSPGRPDGPLAPGELRNLTSGPGKLCRAFAITRAEVDGTSLVSGPVRIYESDQPAPVVVSGRRVGISKAVDVMWRFGESGNRYLSRPMPEL